MAGAWSIYLLVLAAGILLASGGLKFWNRTAWSDAVQEFSLLPRPVQETAKQVLPAVEISLGVLLLLTSGTLLGVVFWAATALMLAFTALIAGTLARGERPSCQCFGATSSEPISGWTLARNGALLVLFGALAVGVAPSSGLFGALADATDDARSGVAALLIGTAAVVVLWVRQDRLLARAGGPLADSAPAGADPLQPASMAQQEIPVMRLGSPTGSAIQLRAMAQDRAQLLVYVSPTCSTCHQLVPLVSEWQDVLGGELDVRLVSLGSRKDSAGAYPHQVDQMWFDEDQGYGKLGIPGTPTALLLGTNGTIAAGPAAGVPAIQELLGTIVQALGVNLMTGAAQQSHAGHDHDHDHDAPASTPMREDQAQWVPDAGKAVPDLTVVREDGSVSTYAEALADLSSAAGVDTVTTVAWSHTCGWCDEVLDDVRQASAGGDVVLVINEDIATVRAQGITGPVLQVMAPGTAVEALGVPGTPAAVPVRDGFVAGLGGIGGTHVLEVFAEHSRSGASA